jgi:DNA polymerase III epsilon subunit-like protein
MEKEKIYIFYDLETNGLDYYTTGIMQITILDYNGNTLLNQYVFPFDYRIDGTNIHNIDYNTLVQNNAINTENLCMEIKKVLREKYDRKDIYFVAYNNFGYDQIILENNFKISKIKIPNNWYFVDLFPIVKEIYGSLRLENYKLKTIYEYIFGKDDTLNYHSSITDTMCLYKIFKYIEFNQSNLIPKYTRTLLSSTNIMECPISSLNGYSSGMKFNIYGINNIGDLYEQFKNMNFNKDDIEFYLQYKIGIYSAYYKKNMVKQLVAIKYLQ